MPLDHALELRVRRRRQHDPSRQRPRERRGGGVHPPGAPDRGLAVPPQPFGHRADPFDQGPHPGQDVRRCPRRDHPRAHEPRVRQRHHQHGQHRDLPRADRDPRRGEPQIALRRVARLVLDPVRRVDPAILRTDHPDPVFEDRDRTRPADPFGDHRGRHRRELPQQRPNLRLDLIHDRALGAPPVPRRRVAGQSRPHRVPRDPHMPRDRLNRHPLRPMQPANLCPILHCDHPPRVKAGGQNSNDATGSVFACRRHRATRRLSRRSRG